MSSLLRVLFYTFLGIHVYCILWHSPLWKLFLFRSCQITITKISHKSSTLSRYLLYPLLFQQNELNTLLIYTVLPIIHTTSSLSGNWIKTGRFLSYKSRSSVSFPLQLIRIWQKFSSLCKRIFCLYEHYKMFLKPKYI